MSKLCPQCGSANVVWDFTCPTYGMDGKFYACMPCDNAIEFFCADQYSDIGHCQWSYTWGANKSNPRFIDNENNCPEWLVGWPKYKDGWWNIPEGLKNHCD